MPPRRLYECRRCHLRILLLRLITRDSRLGDALIVLGEVSPEAKLSVLSGETRVTRAGLKCNPASPLLSWGVPLTHHMRNTTYERG